MQSIWIVLLIVGILVNAKPRIQISRAEEEYIRCQLFGSKDCDPHLIEQYLMERRQAANRIAQSSWQRNLPIAQEPVHGKGNIVIANFYIEAQCPDTTRFVHLQLWPAWQKLFNSDRIIWTLIPFGKARCIPQSDGDFSCQCQHGSDECELNQLMNCAIEQLRYPIRYMPLINCIQGRGDLLDARKQCLDGQHIASVSRLLDCASGPEGRRLLARAGRATFQLQPPLTFVPWITLDGIRSVDSMYDLTENLCNSLIPPPPQCV